MIKRDIPQEKAFAAFFIGAAAGVFFAVCVAWCLDFFGLLRNAEKFGAAWAAPSVGLALWAKNNPDKVLRPIANIFKIIKSKIKQ